MAKETKLKSKTKICKAELSISLIEKNKAHLSSIRDLHNTYIHDTKIEVSSSYIQFESKKLSHIWTVRDEHMIADVSDYIESLKLSEDSKINRAWVSGIQNSFPPWMFRVTEEYILFPYINKKLKFFMKESLFKEEFKDSVIRTKKIVEEREYE